MTTSRAKRSPGEAVSEESAAPAVFVRDLFRNLSGLGADYCVLRSDEGLPEPLGTSDLRLLLKRSGLPLAEKEVRKTLAEHGGSVIGCLRNRSVYLQTMACEDGRWWGLAIDLLAEFDYRGMVYLRSDEVLERSVERQGVRVAAPQDAVLAEMAKELIDVLAADDESVRNARAAFHQYGESCLGSFRHFSEHMRAQIFAFLQGQGTTPEELEELGRAMRKDLERKHGLRLFRYRLAEAAQKLVRLRRRPGSVIVVTGTDGSGKSTLLSQIKPVLQRAFHKRVHEVHLRPHWLPAPGVAAGLRSEKEDGPVENPHAQRPHNFAKSLFRLGYYGVDYSLGFYVRIFPLLVGKARLVCFDRYYIDIIMDPKRMRMSLPEFLLGAVFSLAPKPDVVLCLGGDPQAIYERKPETSLEEVSRQVAFLREYASRHPERAVWVDTTWDLQESVNAALGFILKRLSKRAE